MPGEPTSARTRKETDMNTETRRTERVDEARRIFEEFGIGNVAVLEGWDGAEIDALAEFLTEEEMQTLIDEFADLEDVRE